MFKFLSAAFYPSAHRKVLHGQPQPLFDALQVCLSHLLLSPASKMAHEVTSARGKYNLVRVYNWNEPFSTLYRRVQVLKEEPEQEPESESESESDSDSRPKRKARKSKKKKKPPKIVKEPTPVATEPPEFRLELDMHTLLHIRNFWHRHLIDSAKGFDNDKTRWMGENTYSSMTNKLLRMGITPRKWDKPLKSERSTVAPVWHGHYSCLHPWPKNVQDMEERQTCAEDWKSIDPLVSAN